MEQQINNNTVTLQGFIESDMVFSHEIFREKFYTTSLQVGRLSEKFDNIPLMISDRLPIPVKGEFYQIKGELRSYNKHEGDKARLILFVFVRDIDLIVEDEYWNRIYHNKIYLNGYICKKPEYRVTPLGREITDILMAVNSSYGRSYYLPCICWGRNATYVADELSIGDKIEINGRIQSREYQKKTEDGTLIDRIAYEVSISQIRKVGEEIEM